MFPCNPTADAKNGALFNRTSIDSSGRVAWLPGCLTGKRDASRNPLKCRQNLMSRRLRLVRLVDLGGSG